MIERRLDILVVDDEASNRAIVADILRDQRHAVTVADSGAAALAELERTRFDLMLSDLRMPGMDGLELLRTAQAAQPDLAVILMTAFGTIQSAIEAMKHGAYDYLQKPFTKDELIARIERAAERAFLVRENRRLRDRLEDAAPRILGESAPVVRLLQQVARFAALPSDVLITGESGTGKELIARALHFQGPRASGPFVPVNCAAIPEGIAESELFGHKKGAFTHATSDRAGRFEQAEGGTLFLDEISSMPLGLQPKLLRVLQDRQVERVGASGARQVDVRVVAATNRDLWARVQSGEFREDLYHRLNVLELAVPSLRDRRDDIPLLAAHFAERAARRFGLPTPEIAPQLLEALTRYPFPGNVRELEHTMEKMIAMAEGDRLEPQDLPPAIARQVGAHPAPSIQTRVSDSGASSIAPEALLSGGPVSFAEVEERLLREAIRLSQGNLSEAARRLNLSYKTMRYRAVKFGLIRDAD
ncbi:MAG: sigma-54 dependent transcriptional regulator [Candidatus Eisenbacteria bacterium]